MSDNPNFRSALNGFHRTDVVRYIEFLTSRHNNQVNQLNAEIARLNEQLEQALAVPAQDPTVPAQLAQAEADRDAARATADQLQGEVTALTARIAELEAQAPAQAQQCSSDRELEAYRRAERAERKARERAEQVYHRVNGALADATTQVDEAAVHLTQLAEDTIAQLEQLRCAVNDSKQTLRSAAEVLYTIRPTDED